MKKIKILHILMRFGQGGIENFIMNIYRNIDREKYQLDFALISREKGVFDDEIKALGGNLYYFDTEEKTLKNYRNSLKRIIKDNGGYDAIHSHCYFFSGYILGIAKKCGVKVRIAHSHDTFKGQKLNFKRKVFEKAMRYLINKNATNKLACSKLAGQYVFGANSSFQVLYNGIDLNRFKYNAESRIRVRQELACEDKFILLNVGRFVDQKNHFYILKIFEDTLKYLPNAKLLLIGDGCLMDEVVKQANDIGIADKVLILSNIKNAEDYYNAADCFLLPSKYEGMSIVSVEAQATGLNSLLSNKITDEIAITDLVDYLSIDGSSETWALKIAALKQSHIDRSNYYKTIENSSFNVEKTIEDLCNVYNQFTEKPE